MAFDPNQYKIKPVSFDVNKYRQVDQQMFGPKAFDFSNVQKTVQMQAQADALQKQFMSLYQQRLHPPKPKKPKVEKKTYQDAVNYVSQNKDKFLNPDLNGGKSGAYQIANDIRNNPAKQAELKAQGYDMTDFINALYAGLSDGKFRSEHEYKQYTGSLTKDIKARDKAYKDKHGMTQDEAYALQKQSINKPNHDSSGVLDNIGGLFKDIGHDVSQKAKGAGNELSNIWKAISDGPGGYKLSDVAKDTQKTMKKQQKEDAQRGLSSNLSKEVHRGANRAMDAASLGVLSDYRNKANQQGYNWNTDFASNRPVGKGGVTDFFASGLGYLAPGGLAYKGAKALKVGDKAISGLTKLGASPKLAKTGGLFTEGAVAGGLFGAEQNFADPNMTLKQGLQNIALNTGLGAIGDPLFHVGGTALGKFLGKVKASKQELNSVVSNLELPKELRAQALKVKDVNNGGQNPFNVLNNPLKGVDVKTGGYKSMPRTESNFKTNVVKDDAYYNEYVDALDNQVSLLKSQMGQGVQQGGVVRDVNGDVVNRFGRVSNNPQWYQELFKELGHTPNNEDLYTLAAEQLKNGYVDNGIPIPPWEPSRAQAVGNEIDQLKNIDTHDKQGLQVALDQLQKSKAELSQPQTQININAIPKENPLAKIQKQVAATAENISPETGKLHKLTKTEQYHMNNQDTFAGNNKYKSIPDTSNHIMSKKDVKPSTSGLLDKAQVKLVDNLKPLDWFDKTVEKVTGKKLRPSESSYTLGLNSRGSDMISKQILTKNMVDSKGNVIGKSLKDITKELDPKTLKSFEDYLVNKHAITRMNRGEKVFPDEMKMSPQKSEQIVKAYEEKYPKFKDLSKSYYEYNKQLGKSWLVDTGILSKDEWQGYLKANPNYVPNNRIFQDIERHMNQSAKRGFANQSKPPKKAVGSQRKIVSPIESTIEHTAQYVKTAKRNEVMQTLIKNIQKDPESFKGWAEVVNTDKTSVKETLNKEGIDGVLENINNGFEQKPDLTKGNIVTGIIDGKKVHVKVDDPQLLEALTNLNPKQQHFVVKLFGQMTRVMKNLTTGINPVFSLTRNVFRDIPQSYSNSKSVDNPAKFSKDLVSAFLDVLGNREAYQSFKNFGGGHSSPISSDVNLLAQSKRDILAPKNGVLSTPKRVGGKLLGGLENLNNAVESAPRLAEFKRIAKNGSYDSKVKALYEANDITTNFNKYGDTTKFLDAFVPYLNAAVQGLDKLGRQFFADGKKGAIRTGVKASAAVTLPAIVLYAINHDNPNYKQLSNYIKDQNFLIPTGNGQFIKIPKPRELGVMFGSDVERTLRAWADKDPHAFEGFTEYIKQMFWPPTRPITAPISDIRANKNFMDTPIVPGDLKNLSPKYQYDSQTSEVAKKLGGLFNQSPKNIDYLFKSYGGVLGQLGIPATTKNSTIGNTLKKQVTADPVFSNDILSHFYDEKTKLDTARNDFKKQGVKTKDFNESLRSVFDSRANAISDLRKRMKKAMNNDSLTRNQREQQVRQIQQQINAIAKQTNQLVR